MSMFNRRPRAVEPGAKTPEIMNTEPVVRAQKRREFVPETDVAKGLVELARHGDPAHSIKSNYVSQASLHPNDQKAIDALSRSVLTQAQSRYMDVAGVIAGVDPENTWKASRDGVASGTGLPGRVESMVAQRNVEGVVPVAELAAAGGHQGHPNDPVSRIQSFVGSGHPENVDAKANDLAKIVMDVYEAHQMPMPDDVQSRVLEFASTNVADYNMPSRRHEMENRLGMHEQSIAREGEQENVAREGEPETTALDAMLADIKKQGASSTGISMSAPEL